MSTRKPAGYYEAVALEVAAMQRFSELIKENAPPLAKPWEVVLHTFRQEMQLRGRLLAETEQAIRRAEGELRSAYEGIAELRTQRPQKPKR